MNKKKKYTKFIGTGHYVPNKILTNSDLENMVNTSDKWITERTGIKERHILEGDESSSDMIEIAARKAIEAASIDKNEIDLIIVATLTPEFLTPSAACVLQKRLGIKKCPAFDINAGCSGFIYGLNIVDQYIKNGSAKYILLVGSESLSKVIDWEDRSTCIVFGDGAGAAVLKADSEPGIYDINIGADGSYDQLLNIPSPLFPVNGKSCVHMHGNELFKIAVTKMSDLAQKILSDNGKEVSEIDWLVPHQANLRIIKMVAKKIGLPMKKIILTIEKYGNTSAASVPSALDIAIIEGKIKKGDLLLLDVFGAGLTWGFVLMVY